MCWDEFCALQELRAKVGCPASSLGLLTLSTREPISGEKTLAFSWVSFCHNFILCSHNNHWAIFLSFLSLWMLLTAADLDRWRLTAGGCCRTDEDEAEAPWLRCDGWPDHWLWPALNPAAIQQVDTLINWSSALNVLKRIMSYCQQYARIYWYLSVKYHHY